MSFERRLARTELEAQLLHRWPTAARQHEAHDEPDASTCSIMAASAA